ncbi:MAG: hypothetical protein IKP22_14145 [Clostridia bacterium]|nr:hypothetical protein [Clostridia bacterium]
MTDKKLIIEKNISTWSRFFEMVRKTDRRHSRTDLEFYTRSAMPTLLTMLSCFKPEQL